MEMAYWLIVEGWMGASGERLPALLRMNAEACSRDEK